MAYLDSTVLNNLQPGSPAYNEKLFPERGVLNAVIASTKAIDYIDPVTMEQMMSISSARDISHPVITDQSVTTYTTPGYEFIPANLPTTSTQTYTTYDLFSGFRFSAASYDNNQVRAEYMRNQIILNVLNECANQIEQIIEPVMATRKTQSLNYVTQISQGAGTFTFNSGTDELEISKAALTDTLIYNLQALMRAEGLDGQYRLVTSPGGTASARAAILKYGGNNDYNLQFSQNILSPDRLHESSNISTSDAFDGYWMRDGSIGVIENFPYDFRMRTSINGGSQTWSVSDMPMPLVGLRCNIYTNQYATNATSILTTSDSNLTMSTYEEMAFWFRFTVPFRHNSNLATRVSDIVKLEAQTS